MVIYLLVILRSSFIVNARSVRDKADRKDIDETSSKLILEDIVLILDKLSFLVILGLYLSII